LPKLDASIETCEGLRFVTGFLLFRFMGDRKDLESKTHKFDRIFEDKPMK